tara:strand:- start:85 stop:387 length:303 start_codon:yes stop_codon:yes gene_type:complete
MKLAFIIIPHETKLGSMKKLLSNTIDKFYIEFGGCTHYPVTGIWKGHLDGLPCEKIEIAIEDADTFKFLNYALNVANKAGVSEIMIQRPGGEIEFIKGAN